MLLSTQVQEPAEAGVCGAFPEAVHARKSSEEPGIGGMLRGEVARREDARGQALKQA
jgi:hypothetical protein